LLFCLSVPSSFVSFFCLPFPTYLFSLLSYAVRNRRLATAPYTRWVVTFWSRWLFWQSSAIFLQAGSAFRSNLLTAFTGLKWCRSDCAFQSCD
jgi:hypothetical protein